jgi:hypothetical protein
MSILDSLPPLRPLAQSELEDLAARERAAEFSKLMVTVRALVPSLSTATLPNQVIADQAREAEADPATCTLHYVRLALATKLTHDEEGEGLYSMSDRLIYALGSDDDNDEADHKGSPGRKSFRCPGGCGGRFVFAMQMDNDRMHCRCMGGCTNETLAPILVEKITEHEAQATIDAEDFLVRKMERELSHEHNYEHVAERTEFLIADVLPMNSLVALTARSAGGKTMTAIGMSIAVGNGLPWLGHATKQGRVLTVLAEGSMVEHRRWKRQTAAGFGLNEHDGLEGKVDIYPHALKATDSESMKKLATYIKHFKHVLVVIDSLSMIHDGGPRSENDPSHMRAVCQPLEALVRAFPGLTILVIHHENAAGELRGGDGIKQHFDRTLSITKSSDSNDAILALERGKGRDGYDPGEIRWRVKGGPDDLSLDLEPVGAKQARTQVRAEADPDRARLLKMLPATSGAIYDGMGGNRNRVGQLRSNLEAEGLIVQIDKLWHLAQNKTDAAHVDSSQRTQGDNE